MRYIKEHAELVLQEPRLTGCVTMVFVAIGTDEDSILQLLTARSNAQRQLIKASYKTLHGKVRPNDHRAMDHVIGPEKTSTANPSFIGVI